MITLKKMEFSGYLSQKFDFPELLGGEPQEVQDVVQDKIITPFADAEMTPVAGKFCQITIIGHSDRDDTPGLTSEQRRASELEISQLRADSAKAFLFSQMFDRVSKAGGTPPVDTDSMQNSAILTVAAGSADLKHLMPGNDENQRQENRRVVIAIAAFA